MSDSKQDSVDGQQVTRPVNNPIAENKRNPYTVWFVVVAFVAPVALAYIMFFFVDVSSYVNRGEILNPIVHIADFKLEDKDSKTIPQDTLTYKWRLISFLGKDCDQSCEKRLFDVSQIYKSLGKDRHRVLLMFVHLEPAGESLNRLIAETYPDVIQVYGDAGVIMKALGENIRDDAGILDNEAYIMDPMGNVMMRFTQEQPDRDFLHDLKKLLKVSQIG